MRGLGRLFALLALLLLQPPAAAQRSWTVGAGGDFDNLPAALKSAKSGDSIEVLPGQYHGQVAVIKHKQLTIRGLGERPVFHADGKAAEGKAIWVVRGADILIENIEFRGARVRDRNGAGIRHQGGQLQVRRCSFVDNEAGVISSNNPDARLIVEDSLFQNAVRVGPGLSHLLYVGAIAELQVRGSRFHKVEEGHLLKSRARRSWLGYNLFADSPDGGASYEVELANGGDATLIGNLIVQGPGSHNPIVVAYGAEGQRWPLNRLRLSHNTLLNDKRLPALFLRVWADRVPGAEILAINNLSVGTGVLELGVDGRFAGNLNRWGAVLAAPELFDFSLNGRAWAVGEAVDTTSYAKDLQPDAEFTMPIGTRPLPPPANWVPGAIQR